MAPSKKKQKIAVTEANASDGEEDDLRYANSLHEALAAPNLLHELRGAGGLTPTAYIVGERDAVDEDAVLRAAVATAEAALQVKKV